MTPAERTMLRTLIDRAKRAQVDAQGGYERVEMDAKGQERKLGIYAYPLAAAACSSKKVDIEKAEIMRAAGYTLREIADEFNVTHHAVQYAIDPGYRERVKARNRAYDRDRYRGRRMEKRQAA